MKMNNMQKFEDDLKYFNLSLEIVKGKSEILSRYEKTIYRRLFLDVMKKLSSPPIVRVQPKPILFQNPKITK